MFEMYLCTLFILFFFFFLICPCVVKVRADQHLWKFLVLSEVIERHKKVMFHFSL